MRTLEIVVDRSDMPDYCAYDCDFCTPQGIRRLCLAILKDVTDSIDKRDDDCPLIAWQPSETAPRDETMIMARWSKGLIAAIAFINGDWVEGHGEIVNDKFQWRPLPKTHEV
jgi:hypothetical protein